MIPQGKKEFNGFLISKEMYHRTEAPPKFRLENQEVAVSEYVYEEPVVIGLYQSNGIVESIYTFEESSEQEELVP